MSCTVKQYYRPAFLKKYCAMSSEKYQSRLHNDRCRVLYFLFNPWQIFGWCLLGNVRSSSSGDASFLKIDRHHSWRTSASIFFNQYRWVMFFCRRLLKFSLACKWKDAGVGRHTTSVELVRKNLIDLHWKYYRRHKEKNFLYLKQI